MIYFLRHETGLIKIGTTINYKSRLSDLIRQYGDLELLGLMEGSYEKEGELHSMFSHLRNTDTLDGTEWFAHGDDLILYIETNANLDPSVRSDDWMRTDLTTVKVPPLAMEVFYILQKRYGSKRIGDAVMQFLEECDIELVQTAEKALTLKEQLDEIYLESDNKAD